MSKIINDQSRNLIQTIALVLVQIILIVGLFLTNFIVVADSVEVALKLKPVDPRDLFRGDYMDLRYEINELNVYPSSSPTNLENGDTIYVPIQVSSPISGSNVAIGGYSYGSLYSVLPEQNQNGYLSQSTVYLKGRVESATYSGNQNSYYNFNYNDNQDKFEISYGIEQYFFEEGKGTSIDTENAFGIVKINRKTGEARIDRIEVNGKKWPN